MASGPPSGDVDALRERLRALGYLDARVDRFVLGGAASRSRAASLALAASMRIGLLAGVILGPAAVIGITTRAPGLVTSVTDAMVLAAYLTIPFGVASAVLAFVAILTAGWLARQTASHPDFPSRARRAAIAAGLMVAAVCLAYLTLWWRAAVPPDAWVMQAVALAVAAAISVLIGHVVTISVLAYLARVGLAGLPVGSPLSSWRVVVPVGAVALLGAMALMRTLAPVAAPASAPPPDLTVVPTGVRAVVVAIDGVDVPTLTRLRASGGLPTFDRLVSGASVGLAVSADRDPAQVWTSLATGQPPERHGIRALEGRQLAGVDGRVGADAPGMSMLTTATDLLRLTRPTIASGEERRVPGFWEVAASAGLRTAVVHWWATWPAAETLGTVLSDRAILRLEQGGDLAAEIAPASIYSPLLASASARADRVSVMTASATVGLSPEITTIIERSARLDATVLDLAMDPAVGPQDLLVVYLPGLDIAQHALFPAAPGDTLAPAAAAERVRALEGYYTFLDGALGRTVMASGDPTQLTWLVTQPGRVTGGAAGAQALMAMTGPGAAPRATSDVVSAAALAPTVLRALGVPVAADLPTSSVESLFDDAFKARFVVRTVSTYGERRVGSTQTTGKPLDREMIERMRSLGYVR
jgi:hypothetical protein